MSIIFHIVESTATGTLSMLRLSANAQAAKGHQVKVVYSRRPETPVDLDSLFHPDVELINVQMSGLKNKLLALKKIRSLLLEFKPDSVFMHSSFGGFIGRLASLGLQGNYYYLPHCISFMRKDVSAAKKLLFAALEWVGAIKDCTYVACSQSEGHQIGKYIPFRSCVVIDNAVDVNKWAYESNWATRENVVTTVGQIRLQKDPASFARIAEDVLSTRSDVKFVWVGDGDSQDRKVLEQAGVEVTGWKTPDEVQALLRSSRYYLSTALWEGMPVSPIEAMLSGCCTVLSACAGNVDIIEDGVSGVLFTSVEEGVNKLNALLDGDDEPQKLAQAGRQHCRNDYSQERYIKDFEDLVSGGGPS